MKTKLTIVICALLLGTLNFYSCDNPIALGVRLNLDPPVVTIIKPAFMDNVADTLEIVGTATDLEEVVFLSVTVERTNKNAAPWKKEWQNERGSWNQPGGIWTVIGKPGDIGWAITVSMKDAPDGEYLISAGARNKVNNEGALVQRRVIIDKTGPVVSVFAPVLVAGSIGTASIELNKYQLRNAEHLSWLHNRNIRVRYEIDDEFSINELVFRLSGPVGTNPDGTNRDIYYNFVEKPLRAYVDPPELSWSGYHDIPASKIINPSDGQPLTAGRTLMQLISTARDDAGNEKIYSHGWLIWQPDADKPWTVGGGDATLPSNYNAFPESDIQGQAYDNDGVKSVTYEVYKAKQNGSNWEEDGLVIPSTELINAPLGEGLDPSAFFLWSFKAPKEFGDYLVKIDCKDINGLSGDQEKRLFHVTDITAPNVDKAEADPAPNPSLFGDASGTFALKGDASTGDTYGPTRLTLVWLNPNGDPYDAVRYKAQEFVDWVGPLPNGAFPTTGTSTPDSNGNLRWDLTMSPVSWNATTQRGTKTFNKSIILFTDLGITKAAGAPPLKSQTFILRVEATNGRATTKSFTYNGDMSPPVLAVTGITVKYAAAGKADDTYTIVNGELDPGGPNKMKSLSQGDTITISGTWQDNSTDHWNGATKNGRMKDIAVTWNGKDVPLTTLPGGLSYNATAGSANWTAGPFTVDEAEEAKGGAFIIANLADLGSNLGQAVASVQIDSSSPILVRASSITANASYRTGTINVYLEFNKPVRFMGGTPTLTLNSANGSGVKATANWNPPGGDGFASTHNFTYTINPTDNTPVSPAIVPLSVVSINYGSSGYWEDSINNQISPQVPAGSNVNNLKQIIIDTKAPAISRVTSSYGTGTTYVKNGATINIRVEFDEEIRATNAAGNVITTGLPSITLNVTNSGGTNVVVPATSVSGKIVLFSYLSQNGDNTPQISAGGMPNLTQPLKANSFTLNAAEIRDIAGNALAISGSPYSIADGININAGDSAKNIYVDTTNPPAPTLTIKDSAGTTVTADPFNTQQAMSFTITGGEAGATLEYRTTETGAWSVYTAEEERKSPDTYHIQARQIDIAGNPSSSLAGREVIITSYTPLLQSFGGVSGTYGRNDTVDIEVRLRENVTYTGTITLNLSNGKTAVYNSGNGTNVWTFRYIVGSAYSAAEDTAQLKITSITLSGVTMNGSVTGVIPNSQLPTGPGTEAGGTTVGGWTKGLENVATIQIDTSAPSFVSANLTGTSLTLTFSKAVDKGTGSITLTQQGTYRPPAVMTRAEFNRYGGAAVLGSYYTVGTNGYTVTGTQPNVTATAPDQSEKYILRFDINPADSTADTLRGILTGRGANKVEIPVASGAVSGQGTVTLTVNLSDTYGYALPVKGAAYDLAFPATLVSDKLNNPLTAAGTATVNNPGVNTPFIRIQKDRGGSKLGDPITIGGNFDYTVNQTSTANPPVDSWPYYQLWQDIGWGQPGQYENFVILNSTGYHLVVAPWDPGESGENVANNSTGRTWDWLVPYQPFTRVRSLGAGQWTINATSSGGGGTVRTVEATQPYTADFKIDCQTPDSTITYGLNSGDGTAPYQGNAVTIDNEARRRFNYGTAGSTHPQPTVAWPGSANTAYTGAVTMGTGLNNTYGYLFGIRADASKTIGGTTATARAYERAARSVISYASINGGTLWNANGTSTNTTVAAANNWSTLNGKTQGGVLQLWLRGGDKATGSNLTPGFPLSWDENDYAGATADNPSGARLMTLDTATNTWYWVTWEITDRPALFHFIAGTTETFASLTVEQGKVEIAKGPKRWSWAKNEWAFIHHEYPLFPGASLRFTRATTVQNPATNRFEFYDAYGANR